MSAIEQLRQQMRREARREAIWISAGLLGVLAIGAALGAAIAMGEPKRRAAYMADCEGRGFSGPQCVLLYRQKQDADAATFFAISAVATSAATAAARR